MQYTEPACILMYYSTNSVYFNSHIDFIPTLMFPLHEISITVEVQGLLQCLAFCILLMHPPEM